MDKLVDIILIIFLLSYGFLGAKRGFFKQTVMTVGIILVFILSFYFKDYIANFLSYNLPFFKFTNVEPGLLTLNIVLYQLLGFVFTFLIFSSIFVVLIKVTSVFEKILNATIILGIPSKILGFFVGLIEGYVITFIVLFIVTQPIFNLKQLEIIDDSKVIPVVLNSSPGLSNIAKDALDTSSEIYELVKSFKNDQNIIRFNQNSLDIMLKNNIVKVSYIDKLKDKDKLKFSGIDTVLNKYR